MTPTELLQALRHAGISTAAGPDGRPVLDGPPGSITDTIAQAARQHRWLFVWGSPVTPPTPGTTATPATSSRCCTTGPGPKSAS